MNLKRNFLKEVRKNLLSEKKEKKSNLTKLNKETKSYYKRIVTDIKNKFAVNDDGNESSKNILEQIERFEKLLNDIETKLKPLIKKIDNLRKTSIAFKAAAVASGLLAASLYAIAWIGGISTPFALAVTAAATLFSAIALIIDVIRNNVERDNKAILSLSEVWKDIKNQSTAWIVGKLVSFVTKLSSAKYKAIKSIIAIKNVANVSALSLGKAATLSAIATIYDAHKLQKELEEYEEFQTKQNEFKSFLEDLAYRIIKMKKVKWIVLMKVHLITLMNLVVLVVQIYTLKI
ncbi:hypothetical protein PUW89_03480 [Metamycoplasma hyosynoviae]|uniref:hypothetical protein n=1 Tax=Metamycoplasma hyosynoviae TaxID=29559 RepID=UPI00236691F9|nr:hypothetical protein [Metamycoplasma hyosynoviae]MDD7847890.1 hypothetical protein [Metamycoplasma hyosynoviae]